MKLLRSITLAAALGAASFSSAGEPKIYQDVIPEPEVYEGGRGLITLQGPTGMFLNPTSGTMPAGSFTAQYCFFSPDLDTSVMGHGLLAAYAITDWLEFAALATYVDNAVDPFAAGPQVRVRLMKNEGLIPQLSVGYYGRYGDEPLTNSSIYAAAYNRFPIDEDGVLKSLGIHYGVRSTWFDKTDNEEVRGYFGAEFQLPLRLYVIGEIATKDDDFGDEIPFTYGLQWRAGGINISAAMIQTGELDSPGFYFGVGTQLSF